MFWYSLAHRMRFWPSHSVEKQQRPKPVDDTPSRSMLKKLVACRIGSWARKNLDTNLFCCSAKERAALFLDPEMSFSRPRDWSILFSAAACLFFDLQLFFSPAMRLRKRAQSFFQPLCIILSSLFLGPETSCSEPRIFFRTPRHLFLDLWCFF